MAIKRSFPSLLKVSFVTRSFAVIFSLVPQQALTNITPGHVRLNLEEGIGPISREIFGVHTPDWNKTVFQCGIPNPTLLRSDETGWGSILRLFREAYGPDFIWSKINLPTEIDTDEPLLLVKELGAIVKSTMNLPESSKLAADWVDYVNTASARVQHREIMNEPYFTMSVTEYINKLRTFVPFMKAVGSGIGIRADMSVLYPEFTQREIRRADKIIDIYSVHLFLLLPPQRVWSESPYTEVTNEDFFKDLLHSSASVPAQLATLKWWVKEGYPERKLGHLVVSFAPAWWGPEDWAVTSLPAALWTADLLGTFAQEQLKAAATWALMNRYPPGQGDFGIFSPEMKPYARYYPYAPHAQCFGQLMVKRQTDVKGLSTYASLSENGQNLYLIHINKSPDEDMRVSLDLSSFQSKGDAAAWILDGPMVAENPYYYGLCRESLEKIASEFQWSVSPYSMIALEILSSSSALRLDKAPNLALDKVATGSSVTLCTKPKCYKIWGFIPDRAIDGDLTTRWHLKFSPENQSGFKSIWGRSLNSTRSCYAGDTGPPTRYTITISDDGRAWRETVGQSEVGVTAQSPQLITRVTLDRPVIARYIRINMVERTAKSGVKAGCFTWAPSAFSL